ncbi:TonB-dependent receptor [Ectothiorhodospira shaposhnikovii]|uniref:TonB-dependent receptor n=1 Tax=Ectothiorhodospira shaposhnikovii TaxID=1054 RepID=UPI001906D4DF|nr:TonB-dependent receptor [Ectothiorhodospira shaposhnikovii]
MCTGTATAQSAPPPEPRDFQVTAATLEEALNSFARQAGITLLFDPALVSGLQARSLQGTYRVEEGLSRLLAGTALEAARTADNEYVLRKRYVLEGLPPGVEGMSQITVTGTRMATDVQRYPGSVTVLEEADLRSHSTVIEAMAGVPGVTTGGDSGRGIGQQFNVRGFGYQSEDRVIILQDGVRRSASLYSNQISTFRSDNDLLKRVEVVKGASSVNHGSGAIGGVIAMTTKDAHDFLSPGEETGLETRVRYETNNYKETYVAGAAAPSDGNFELLAYGKRGRHGDLTLARAYDVTTDTKSDTVDNQEDLRVAFIKGAYNLNDHSRLTLSYYDYVKDTEVTWQTLYHPGYSAVTGPVYGNLMQRDIVAGYTLNPFGSNLVNLSASLYQSHASYDRGYDYVDNSGQSRKLDYENEDRRWGLRLQNEMQFDAFSAANRLLLGLDYERRKEDASYVLNGAVTEFGSMPNTYEDTGLFAHMESRFLDDALVVQVSGRYDRFDRSVDANPGSYDNDNFSPRLGASLRLFEGFHLLGNVSESFRAPTPHETSSEGPLNRHYWYLPNPDLKPEVVTEYELGFSYTRRHWLTANDHLRVKFMYFDGTIKDMIALRADHDGPVSEEGTPFATYRNVDRVSRDGFEASLAYDAPMAGGSLGFSRVNLEDEATGEKTPQAFADKATLTAYYRPLSTLRLGASVNHWFKPDQNPKTITSGGVEYWYVRESFTQTGINAVWTPRTQGNLSFMKDVEVAFGVNNLFDKPYINARDVETTSRVGKGRNVYLSLGSRF